MCYHYTYCNTTFSPQCSRIRLNTARTLAPTEQIHASLKFHHMKPRPKESLSQFHSRLSNQVKKCGFHTTTNESFEDRMVRDRLLSAVDKDDLEEILLECPDPTVCEIIDKCDKYQRFQHFPGWSRILSYLNLIDLENFRNSHRALNKIVKSYLTEGKRLLIDQDTLWQYPIDKHGALYTHLGSLCTNLTISGIYALELGTILPFFPKLIKLTLQRVHVFPRGYKLKTVPKIRDLCVLDSIVGQAFASDWHMLMLKLDSLNLQGNDSIPMTYLPPEMDSLTLINQRVTGEKSMIYGIKRLTLGQCWWPLSYEYVQKCRQGELRHLRISQSCDWKHKQEIYALRLPSVDVHYHEIPKEENLIMRLNDDCLLHMKSFLTSDSSIAFRKTHPRFGQFRIDNCDILFDSVRKNTQVYRPFGPHVDRLTLRIPVRLPDSMIQELIQFFPNLSELHLHSTQNSCSGLDLRHLGRLRKMSISFKGPLKMRSLFARTNPSLSILEINDDSKLPTNHIYSLVCQLNNLKELTIRAKIIPKTVMEMPSGSFPHLEKLSLDIGDYGNTTEFLNSLDGERLRSLTIKGPDSYGTIFKGFRNHFNGLEELDLNVNDCILQNIDMPNANILKCINLKQLSGQFDLEADIAELLKRLPQLTHLQTVYRALGSEAIIATKEFLRRNDRVLWLNGKKL